MKPFGAGGLAEVLRSCCYVVAARRKQGATALDQPWSSTYWETRYAQGGTSGTGSSGDLAIFKAEILNAFVKEHEIGSIVEFGCGDGNQLALLRFTRYIGLDVSRSAVTRCKSRFHDDPTKSFYLYDPACFVDNHRIFAADAALSMDVIFHLVEDEVFRAYMTHLFQAGRRWVVIYSNDAEHAPDSCLGPHVRHRRFSEWIRRNMPQWKLEKVVKNRYPYDPATAAGSWSDFHFYTKVGAGEQKTEVGS